MIALQKTLKLPPNLENAVTDREEASWTNANTLIELPNRVQLNTDKLDPQRMKYRSEKLLENDAKSWTDSRWPKHTNCRTDKPAPKNPSPKTERLEPNVVNLRTDNAAPKEEACATDNRFAIIVPAKLSVSACGTPIFVLPLIRASPFTDNVVPNITPYVILNLVNIWISFAFWNTI
jgi:hypothetical protein